MNVERLRVHFADDANVAYKNLIAYRGLFDARGVSGWQSHNGANRTPAAFVSPVFEQLPGKVVPPCTSPIASKQNPGKQKESGKKDRRGRATREKERLVAER